MNGILSYASSAVGSKKLVGLTGLGLCLFLLIHLAGNLLILAGPEAFNTYSHKLVTNELLPIAEVGLVALILIHIFKATWLTIKNKSARPVPYAMTAHGEKKTTVVSRTLIAQGAVIFVFIILHLITFKYGPHYTVTYKGEEMRDLYKLVLEVFRQPGYVAWYVIALLVLGLHLGHGFYSSFQSLGLNSPRFSCFIKGVGVVYDIVITAGFIILPLYVYFLHR